MDHRQHPVLFHIDRDPGEKYPIAAWKTEYKEQVKILRQIVQQHQDLLVPGDPQLNWCDRAAMVVLYFFSFRGEYFVT